MRGRGAWFAGLALLAASLAACGGGDASPPVATSTTPSLIAVTDGTAGVMILEWRGGPADARRWQYRQKVTVWEVWTDIPGSDTNTRSHRISGLKDYEWYEFEVRAWTATGTGEPSNTEVGVTLRVTDSGILVGSGRIIMGGKTYRLFGYYLDIPSGMRLAIAGPAASSSVFGFHDVFTGSVLELDVETGEFVLYAIVSPDGTVTASRRDTANDDWIVDTKLSERLTTGRRSLPKESGAELWEAEANWEGVAGQFDQIADSIRKAPPLE